MNRIAVVELRTDPKYGKFIQHEPARAKVKIARLKDKLVVEVEDFISPTIITRLQQQAGVLSPKIDDWRVMVDCVMIDPAYDGKVFNVALSDVPEKKTDLVAGRYELPAQNGKATVEQTDCSFSSGTLRCPGPTDRFSRFEIAICDFNLADLWCRFGASISRVANCDHL